MNIFDHPAFSQDSISYKVENTRIDSLIPNAISKLPAASITRHISVMNSSSTLVLVVVRSLLCSSRD